MQVDKSKELGVYCLNYMEARHTDTSLLGPRAHARARQRTPLPVSAPRQSAPPRGSLFFLALQSPAMEPDGLEEGESLASPERSRPPAGLELVLNGENVRVAVVKEGAAGASQAFRGARLDIASFWTPGGAGVSALTTLLLGCERGDVWVLETDSASAPSAAHKLHTDCIAAGKTASDPACTDFRSCLYKSDA